MFVVAQSPHEDDTDERHSGGDTATRTVAAGAYFSVDQAEE